MSMADTRARAIPRALDEGRSIYVRLFDWIPDSIIALLARFIVGLVFWNSGLTKIKGFGDGASLLDAISLKESTFFLFRDEYKLPLIPPDIAAYMGTAAELTMPLLLWVGLGSRLAATVLFLMTLSIEIFVYPDAYITHGLWAIGLLYIMKHGPGIFSLDHVLGSVWSKH